ncbi:MAG TPA: ROK family transcriptional regulator [Bauldia sp.]|nr:ROK family transcriptional regulator [Bauldia sp.]
MKLKGDPSTTRALNRRLILDQIRRNGPMSRAALTAAVGLSPAAVTFVTAELIAEGLLVEGKALLGAAGRRPIPLDIDYTSKLSIGVKVSIDSISGVITDLATRVRGEVELPLPDHAPETVVRVATATTDQLLAEAGVTRRRLIGVGLAVSGQVDAEKGICRQEQRFGWRDVPIAVMLADELGVPVWVDNDANAYAVAQHLFGHGRGTQSIAAIALGRGVGAGLVVEGRLHRGASGGAGEFGHNFEQRGRRCECGRDGCLETWTADIGLLQSWAERDPSSAGRDIAALAAAVAASDPPAKAVIEDAALRLGRHVANLANVVDPEMIIFGGEGVRFGRHLFDPLRSVLAEVCYSGAPPIAIDWEGTGWARGAAALAVQHFFNFEATGGYTPKTEGRKSVA